jgi:hypothetical protein
MEAPDRLPNEAKKMHRSVPHGPAMSMLSMINLEKRKNQDTDLFIGYESVKGKG